MESIEAVLDLDKLRADIAVLEEQAAAPSLWDNPDEAQKITSGFGFLENTAGFGVNQSLIPYNESDTYGRVFLVGLLNTLLVAGVGAHRLPYALTAAMATIFPSIYVDVQVVLASPVARSTAPFIGPTGLPHMAGALGTGIFAGYVFVIPGLAAISIAGLLDIRLGDWLLYGVVFGLVTALVSTLLMRLLFSAGGFWNPETDEEVDEAMAEQEAADRADLTGEADTSEEALASSESEATAAKEQEGVRQLPLVVLMLPILVPLLLIALGAFAACGGDGDEDATDEPTSPESSATTDAPTDEPSSEVFEARMPSASRLAEALDELPETLELDYGGRFALRREVVRPS